MSSPPKKAGSKQNISGAKATILAAVVAGVFGIVVALIPNADKIISPKDPSQVEAAIVLEKERHATVLKDLDAQASLVEPYRFTPARFETTPQQGLSKTENNPHVESYLQSNKECRRFVQGKHSEVLAAVTSGESLKASALRIEINRSLAEDYRKFVIVLNMLKITPPSPPSFVNSDKETQKAAEVSQTP